ncbi:MAG: NTP transferase domain-containing protein, partial [Holosporales bacterium]
MTTVDILVLAAGKGTRMRSPLPKVLHALAGRSMLEHVLAAARSLTPQSITAVVSDDFNTFAALAADVKPVVQRERLGTGHAVRVACDAAAPKADAVLVLYGDTPLLTAASMRALLGAIAGGADVAVLGFTPVDAGAYGRLVVDASGTLTRIVEYNDANADERAIRLCNAGIMAFRRERLLKLLPALTNTNSKGEYYLTDLVGLATAQGGRCAAVTAADENDVLGVNSRAELAVAEGILQGRLRANLLEKGVTLPLPETVYLSADLDCAADVIIEPFVYI